MPPQRQILYHTLKEKAIGFLYFFKIIFLFFQLVFYGLFFKNYFYDH